MIECVLRPPALQRDDPQSIQRFGMTRAQFEGCFEAFFRQVEPPQGQLGLAKFKPAGGPGCNARRPVCNRKPAPGGRRAGPVRAAGCRDKPARDGSKPARFSAAGGSPFEAARRQLRGSLRGWPVRLAKARSAPAGGNRKQETNWPPGERASRESRRVFYWSPFPWVVTFTPERVKKPT